MLSRARHTLQKAHTRVPRWRKKKAPSDNRDIPPHPPPPQKTNRTTTPPPSPSRIFMESITNFYWIRSRSRIEPPTKEASCTAPVLPVVPSLIQQLHHLFTSTQREKSVLDDHVQSQETELSRNAATFLSIPCAINRRRHQREREKEASRKRGRHW